MFTYGVINMKIRNGFISNSSSSNFIVLFPNTKLTLKELQVHNKQIIEEWGDFQDHKKYIEGCQEDIEKIYNATKNNQIIEEVTLSLNDDFENYENIIKKCGGYLTGIGEF